MRLGLLFLATAVGAVMGASAGRAETPTILDQVAPPGIVQVQDEDCHERTRRHFLPEYGRRVLHHHRGRNCRVVIDEDFQDEEPDRSDCHREPQRHYLEEYGRRVWHTHRGRSCRVQILQEQREQQRGCFRAGPIWVCP
jgi:hypothetical protein